MTYRKLCLTLGTCTFALFSATAAGAQQSEVPTPNDSSEIADTDLTARQKTAAITGEAAAGDIVVTGTRIIRPNTKSAAPIVTTTATEIQAQGATTIEEVLNRLPQVQVNTEQNFSDSEGRQRIKLRSLGYERTLMLVDGLRFGLPNTIDVGIIPTMLTERIDVLSGGASSVYGSDAVSGVVNFILKKNFEGVRFDANYSFFNHHNRDDVVARTARAAGLNFNSGWANDGARANMSVAAGVNLFDGRINITTYLKLRAFGGTAVLQPLAFGLRDLEIEPHRTSIVPTRHLHRGGDDHSPVWAACGPGPGERSHRVTDVHSD